MKIQKLSGFQKKTKQASKQQLIINLTLQKTQDQLTYNLCRIFQDVVLTLTGSPAFSPYES